MCGRIQAWWAKGCQVCRPVSPSELRTHRQLLGQLQPVALCDSLSRPCPQPDQLLLHPCLWLVEGRENEQSQCPHKGCTTQRAPAPFRSRPPRFPPLVLPSRQLHCSLCCFSNLPATLPPWAPQGLCLCWSRCLECASCRHLNGSLFHLLEAFAQISPSQSSSLTSVSL